MAAKLYKNEDLNPDGTPKEGAVGIDLADNEAVQRFLLENADKLTPELLGVKPKADLITVPNVKKMNIGVDDVVEFISEVVKEAEKSNIDLEEAMEAAKAKLKELVVADDLINEAIDKYEQGITASENITSIIPPEIWNTSIDVVKAILKKGGNLERAIRQGVAYIKQTDWWKNATTEQQQTAIDEFAKKLDELDGTKPVESEKDKIKESPYISLLNLKQRLLKIKKEAQAMKKKPRFALPSGHPDFKKKMEEYNKNQVEQMLKEKREAQPIEKFENVYKGLEKLATLSEEANKWKAEQEAKKQHNQPIAKMENKKLPPIISYIKKQFSRITALAPLQKKRIYIGLGIVSIILFITNPSINDFKGYCEYDVEVGGGEAAYIKDQKEYEDNPDVQTRTYARTSYWLIFSVYQVKVRISDGTQKKITYIGAFNTFFKTSEKNEYN